MRPSLTSLVLVIRLLALPGRALAWQFFRVSVLCLRQGPPRGHLGCGAICFAAGVVADSGRAEHIEFGVR